MLTGKLFQLLRCLHLWISPVASLVELSGIIDRKARPLARRLSRLIASREHASGQRVVADDAYALIKNQG